MENNAIFMEHVWKLTSTNIMARTPPLSVNAVTALNGVPKV
jgi:hypothetical protein